MNGRNGLVIDFGVRCRSDDVDRNIPIKSSVPLRVDPLFFVFAREAIVRDPSLNMRKVTKNIAKQKNVVGQLMFSPDFAKDMEKVINLSKDDYAEVMNNVDAMFAKKRLYP